MATHGTLTRRGGTRARTPARHPHHAIGWALPAVLGVIVGFWAFYIHRDGGATTGGLIWLGVASGVAFAVLCFALGRVQGRLPAELRAAAYGAVTAIVIGYLFSLHHHSVLSSAVLGLGVGAGVTVYAFYLFHTRSP
ncbi:hypothetical protein ACIPJG_19435 [Streptomyces halstedii]|uniref:hypothetical protein n=1 Tax=Streptomyces TaxID=1883 RepID=UPI0004913DDB|nr:MULTISPECIES: hypothetical protein [Streptomyces]WSX37233.1 hypothetical protein OG291_17030 [Streptomyces halstedii]KDQ68249.1 hypothetical protein DT87_13880 [Streptomyces sp. NTK 937]MYR71116.1 hypothetical protein [Streptomyces sp. SID4925]MYY17475.1 hypothetical protein [Streptomyces sp. SID4912]SBV02116.1 hypothetical protein YUMDRAFT_02610 [Streptomyces sp. OspMP-M45]